MKSQGWTLGDSVQYVKCKREVIAPNIGFLKQLMEYELVLMGKNSWRLSDYQELFKEDFIEY
jgi:hypothetical protein